MTALAWTTFLSAPAAHAGLTLHQNADGSLTWEDAFASTGSGSLLFARQVTPAMVDFSQPASTALSGPITYATPTATVVAGATDISIASAYASGTLPATTSDVLFDSAVTYTTPAGFTLTSANLSIGSLNVTNTQGITISGSSTTAKILTLNGSSGDTLSPNTSDLIYLASGANLTLASVAGKLLNLSVTATGNFDVAGSTNTLTISAPITSTVAINKIGAGTLALSGTSTAFTGGLADQAGTTTGAVGARSVQGR